MSSRLVRKQLSALQQDREGAPVKAEVVKKRRANKKQQKAQAQQQAATDPTAVYKQNLKYLKATKKPNKEVLDVMAKVRLPSCLMCCSSCRWSGQGADTVHPLCVAAARSAARRRQRSRRA
jgi:hypothetical protein